MSVLETSLALADVQLNVIMKKLTGWAAIIAVPTLITGFVGMNVGFPFMGTAYGFWIYLVIMLATAAGAVPDVQAQGLDLGFYRPSSSIGRRVSRLAVWSA